MASSSSLIGVLVLSVELRRNQSSICPLSNLKRLPILIAGISPAVTLRRTVSRLNLRYWAISRVVSNSATCVSSMEPQFCMHSHMVVSKALLPPKHTIKYTPWRTSRVKAAHDITEKKIPIPRTGSWTYKWIFSQLGNAIRRAA